MHYLQLLSCNMFCSHDLFTAVAASKTTRHGAIYVEEWKDNKSNCIGSFSTTQPTLLQMRSNNALKE